ncbi:MAG TPA: alanine racemase [Gemmatimonadaceae bacterium]|nr:alanine racemase [Gemmatimonadaceae bacterium]
MNDLPRRAWVDVDLGALVRNAQTMQRRASVPLLPMVKADAYGLGAIPAVRALERVQPWGYGVATVAEGAELRAAGVGRPIVVFTPLLTEDFPAARQAHLTPTLGDPRAIAAWIETGAPWHLAIDTGMQRAGVPHTQVGDLVDLVRRSPPEGAFTHFHSADVDLASIEEQQALFEAAIAVLPERPRYLHAENSPGIEQQSPSPWDLARPGIFLYGVSTATDSGVPVQPVAHLRGRIVEMREVSEGQGVSYGHTWRAPRTCRIATVNAGYADGVKRALGNRSQALVRGQAAPIAGVVTMDMTMLDVSAIDCEIGDVATLIGRDGDALIDLGEAARAAQISPYEVLTGLRSRAERRYVGS